MQKITPFLWFDRQAEEAGRFYVSVFKNAKLGAITHYTGVGPLPRGTVMTVSFILDGQEFVALNGGPAYKISPAVSFVVNCETQADIDYYWDKLTADGGKPVQCGWLEDKFGVSWQIVPAIVFGLLAQGGATAERVMAVVGKSIKLDIAELEKAAKS